MSDRDLLTPEHRAELSKQLGDRRFDGTGHTELLTDDVTGLAVLGVTLRCTDGSLISFMIDSGPGIERMRENIRRAERAIEQNDEVDSEEDDDD